MRLRKATQGRSKPLQDLHLSRPQRSRRRAAGRRTGPRRRGYFLTDGASVDFRDFATRLLATRGVTPPDKAIPRWLAWALASASEWLWETFALGGAPPATRVRINIGGQEVTVRDAKARRELGYVGRVSIDEGLRALER
jgi:nucleoside-diphosphate-sugar epimerase